jgi:hypothetical protein
VLANTNADAERAFVSKPCATDWYGSNEVLAGIKTTQTPEVHDYVKKISADWYARIGVPVSRIGRETSNNVDEVSVQLVELQQKPIIELLEVISDKADGKPSLDVKLRLGMASRPDGKEFMLTQLVFHLSWRVDV